MSLIQKRTQLAAADYDALGELLTSDDQKAAFAKLGVRLHRLHEALEAEYGDPEGPVALRSGGGDKDPPVAPGDDEED